ncbi:MAG: DEAD/DEAH box helicase [Clostridiaceae bacterium]|nr:DEAD/DEAH box helicase [Clostridiaceae bacterium]
MFHVKIDTIREQTTNGPTYMKGRQYYRQGQVKHLTFDQEKGIILAQVDGTRTYNVRIILDGKGELHDATCTCSAFSAYWGLCRHIAAALLYCVDTFGQEKTHIIPSVKPDNTLDPDNQARQAADPSDASADGADLTDSDNQTAGETSGQTSMILSDISRQQQSARQQAQRRSRSKTRDFIARMDHVVRLLDMHAKKIIRLQVVLHCSRNSCALPWLSFAIGDTVLHPVANVEQFAEAVSRDLPLELDKDFTFNPMEQCFAEQDQALIYLLQDAFENDYKAVFGTSHASSRDRFFTLNASRFADFLSFSGTLSECCWQGVKDQHRQPIYIRRANLPIKLQLSLTDDGNDHAAAPYRLELLCDQPLQQMTASRNIYLVGDVFYLPPRESIRLLEPILSTFNTPGCRFLYLCRDEAISLISMIAPRLVSACPLLLQTELESRLIREPLRSRIDLDYSAAGLRADMSFHYGDVAINPLSEHPPELDIDRNTLVLRDFQKEDQLASAFMHAGFARQGGAWRLSDPDQLYQFLQDGWNTLQEMAEIRFTDASAPLVLQPMPDIRIRFSWSDNRDDLLLEQNYGGLSQDDLSAYLNALRERRQYIRTRNGDFRQVNPAHRETLPVIMDLLQLWNVHPDEANNRLPRYRALALENLLRIRQNQDQDQDQDQGAAPIVQADDAVRDLIHHLREPGSLSFRIPQSMRSILRPYQKIGVQWLCALDYYGLGGILADDMGLGKTLQTITFVMMVWQRHKRPSLIIAPTSLVYNWLNEFDKFSPHLPVMLIDGNRQQRSSQFQEIDKQACVITSYSLLRRDIDDLSRCSFISCFLDEAQNIKNPDTLNARSVKQVQADRYFALTGTPIENSLLELWSIFDFILPGYLHSQRVFQNLYELPIVRDGSQTMLADLHRQIMPFVLRRMKKDVLKELPDKIESRTICDMTEEQRKIYQAFLTQSRNDLVKEVQLNGYSHSQIYILALLTRLRQICCHPALFLHHYEGGSGKLMLLEELLADSFSAGHRVLVFSQFTSMLELIRDGQKANGITPFYIDGQIPADERINQVQRFNQGEGKLFLVSLRAGGTGLNLTGADTVIHFDPWWNPAVEEQATDRAYRIGQENIVQVFKLYTRHSVEEKILALQQKKQNLIDAIIKPDQNLLSKMTLDEVLSLFES